MPANTSSVLLRAASVAAVALAFPAAAQRPDSTTLPRVVITATRVETPVAGEAFASTVLSGNELRRAGVRDLAEALQRVPGVAIARTGGPGAQASLFLRGGESDYVRVMIDGVPVNDAGGAIDLSWLSLHDVERIEVVRGPSSVLYGTDAVTGVVQIFTREGRGAPRLEAAAEAARYGTTRGEVALLAGDATAALALTAARDRSDGLLPFNNAYASDLFTLRGRMHPGARTRLQFAARHADETYHYPTDGAGAVVDRNAWRADRRAALSAELAHEFTTRWRGEVGVTQHRARGRTLDLPDDAADTAGFFAYRSRAAVLRRSAGARLHFASGPASIVTLGVEWASDRQESTDSSNYDAAPNHFDADRLNRAYFAQWLAERGRLSFSAGARYDDHDTFGDFRTARGALAWRISRELVVRVAAGNAFKAPTFFESFSTAFSVGNPSLVPERSRSWEVGLRHDRPDGRLALGATWFDQRFQDLIQYTFQGAGQPNYFNVARASARGLELDGAASVSSWLRAFASGTLLRTRVEDAGFDTGTEATFVRGERLLRRPSASATAGLSAVPSARTTFDVTARFTGSRDDRSFVTYPATPVRLPAYTRLDVGATQAVAAFGAGTGLQLHARIENLLGARYTEVANFPAPGRTLAVGMRLEVRR